MAINRLVCKAVRLRVIIILFLLFLDSNDICHGALCMVPVVDGGEEEGEGLTHPCTWCGREDDVLTGAADGLMLV